MGYETMYQVSMILAPFEAATHPFHPAEISSHCPHPGLAFPAKRYVADSSSLILTLEATPCQYCHKNEGVLKCVPGAKRAGR